MVDNAKRASDFLKALAHESRLMILCILAEGESRSVSWKICSDCGSRAVSRAARALSAQTGWSLTRRDGKAIYYKLARRGAYRHRRDLRRVLPEDSKTLVRLFIDRH